MTKHIKPTLLHRCYDTKPTKAPVETPWCTVWATGVYIYVNGGGGMKSVTNIRHAGRAKDTRYGYPCSTVVGCGKENRLAASMCKKASTGTQSSDTFEHTVEYAAKTGAGLKGSPSRRTTDHEGRYACSMRSDKGHKAVRCRLLSCGIFSVKVAPSRTVWIRSARHWAKTRRCTKKWRKGHPSTRNASRRQR